MKRIHVIGGGTFSHVRSHLALAAPAFGETAIHIAEILRTLYQDDATYHVALHLTRMADPRHSEIVTNDDVATLVDTLVADPETRVIVFNPALCDFDAEVVSDPRIPSGKYAERIHSRDSSPALQLTAARKIIGDIRKKRKDIFVVGFKTTTGATPLGQYIAGLHLLKGASVNLVLANDVVTRLNMIIVPEEARYHETTNRSVALAGLAEMVKCRSGLAFTRSTIVGDEHDLVPWTDDIVPANLRTVVDYMVARGAYKPFRGSTAGHFAVKIGPNQFLTSRRKTNFNSDLRLVRVETDGPDRVVAYGARPSVGGQSQRIVFNEHPDVDCIVHAHVPLRPDAPDKISVRSQYPYECGSTACGQNTSDGLVEHATGRALVKAVMLDNHGPNIVFSRDTPAYEVIQFIERNFDITAKTGGIVG